MPTGRRISAILPASLLSTPESQTHSMQQHRWKRHQYHEATHDTQNTLHTIQIHSQNQTIPQHIWRHTHTRWGTADRKSDRRQETGDKRLEKEEKKEQVTANDEYNTHTIHLVPEPLVMAPLVLQDPPCGSSKQMTKKMNTRRSLRSARTTILIYSLTYRDHHGCG